MPPSLVFDMHDSEPSSSPEYAQKIRVVTSKRKATGRMAALVHRGVGPVSDVKEAFAMKLRDFAVIEYDDTKKRARAVLTAVGDGNVGAVPLTPNHEKAAVKAAYLHDQGTEKALVPWAKLPSMTSAAWLGAHMTISDALQEYTRPKPRAPKEAAKHAETLSPAKDADSHPASKGASKASTKTTAERALEDPVAMPTVVVPQVASALRRVTPKLVKGKMVTKVVEESEDEIDLTKASDDESGTSEDECDTDNSDASTADEAQSSDDDGHDASQGEEEEDQTDDDDNAETDDAESDGSDDDGSEISGDEADEEGRPKKRRRVYEVVAKYLDDDRELTAKFKVHSKREMNNTFNKFRETGQV